MKTAQEELRRKNDEVEQLVHEVQGKVEGKQLQREERDRLRDTILAIAVGPGPGKEKEEAKRPGDGQGGAATSLDRLGRRGGARRDPRQPTAKPQTGTGNHPESRKMAELTVAGVRQAQRGQPNRPRTEQTILHSMVRL